MSELSDKVKGWTMSIVGAGGVLSGIGLIIDEPKKIIGYSGAMASASFLCYSIEYLKKAYSNKKYNNDIK